MSADFRIGEAHLYPAEPAGSTRTTDATDRERDTEGEREIKMHISSSYRENVTVSGTNAGASVILE